MSFLEFMQHLKKQTIKRYLVLKPLIRASPPTIEILDKVNVPGDAFQ